jgi:hypothetical protein
MSAQNSGVNNQPLLLASNQNRSNDIRTGLLFTALESIAMVLVSEGSRVQFDPLKAPSMLIIIIYYSIF